MEEYRVIYEEGPQSWGAYSPDVPGCIAVGKTREEVERNFREALEFHLEGLLLEGTLLDGLKDEPYDPAAPSGG